MAARHERVRVNRRKGAGIERRQAWKANENVEPFRVCCSAIGRSHGVRPAAGLAIKRFDELPRDDADDGSCVPKGGPQPLMARSPSESPGSRQKPDPLDDGDEVNSSGLWEDARHDAPADESHWMAPSSGG